MKNNGIYVTADDSAVLVAPNSTTLNPSVLSRPLLSSSGDSFRLNEIISTCPIFTSSHWMSRIYENPEYSTLLMKEYSEESCKINSDGVYTSNAQISLPYVAMIHEILAKELQRDTSISFSWNFPPDSSFVKKIATASTKK